MKNCIAALLIVAVLLGGFTALADEAVNVTPAINTLIDEGGFVVQIDVSNGDLGWVADDMAQDDSVVTLYLADVLEDTFVARYEPTGDGDVSVGVRHYTGIACDQYLTWNLHVEDGAVQGVTGGSYTASPSEEEQDPYLSGEWLEAETQFTQMTVEKNAERGWDVEVAAPLTHGAYVFKTTIYYDCELSSFVYDKGKFWDVPVTEEENPELGEAAIAGTCGSFALSGEAGRLTLHWVDDQRPEEEVVFERATGKADAGIDYLALVNKQNPLPEGWEDALETVHTTNSVGTDVEVEAAAYEAYLQLAADLEANDGIHVELDSAFRSIAEQQEIMDNFIEEYGADYAAKTVAQPGFSEHHTGLALDLYLIVDGKTVYHNEDLVQYPEIWDAIHAKLADYGFILRYLKDKEHITGYGYEPWHIRYLDDAEIAREIMSQPGMTLEAWLGAVNDTGVVVDYGASELYTPEELEEAAVQAKCQYAFFDGCELHAMRYAGDACNTAENLEWVNELEPGKNYVQVAEFLTDFHTPADAVGAWEPDTEYTDYQWWLARAEEGGWQLVSWGY